MRKVTNREEMEYIFSHGTLYGDKRANNYATCPDYISFYVIDDVCFAGVRRWGKYARIFDRYFVYPAARAGVNYKCTVAMEMKDRMVADAKAEGLIPFFSIELSQKAAANAARTYGFDLLPDKYQTFPDSWQWIAIERGHNGFQQTPISTDNYGESS